MGDKPSLDDIARWKECGLKKDHLLEMFMLANKGLAVYETANFVIFQNPGKYHWLATYNNGEIYTEYWIEKDDLILYSRYKDAETKQWTKSEIA